MAPARHVVAGRRCPRQGTADMAALVWALHGRAALGWTWQGRQGMARSGDSWLGGASRGSSGDSCTDVSRLAEAHHGFAVTDGHGTTVLGPPALGWARHRKAASAALGVAVPGRPSHDIARQHWIGPASDCVATRGISWQRRLATTSLSSARQGVSWQHGQATAWPGASRPGKSRQQWLRIAAQVGSRQFTAAATECPGASSHDGPRFGKAGQTKPASATLGMAALVVPAHDISRQHRHVQTTRGKACTANPRQYRRDVAGLAMARPGSARPATATHPSNKRARA